MMIEGMTLVAGVADGPVLALAEPLSFWGGFDATTGNVIDRRHPDLGRCLTGTVVVVSAARGSSSGSSVLAEAIRAGTAPAAFIISTRDAILQVGAMVAGELYARWCPILVVGAPELSRISQRSRVRVSAGGTTGSVEAI
jgi:predicted aconitase with swiveling domain